MEPQTEKQEPTKVTFATDVIWLPIDEVKPNNYNPNYMPQNLFDDLIDDVRRNKFYGTIIINKEKIIVDGEHRWRALKALGEKMVPCIMDSDLDLAKSKIATIRLNREKGYLLPVETGMVLNSLTESMPINILSEVTHIPLDELTVLTNLQYSQEIQEETEPIPIKPIKPKSKLGDIYLLGKHRIMCGDCTDPNLVNQLLQNILVDQLLTDPPYGVDYGAKNRFLNTVALGDRIEEPILGDQDIEDYRVFFASFLRIIPFAEKNTIYVFLAGKHSLDLELAFNDCGLTWTTWLIWKKNNHVLGRMDYATIHEPFIYGWKGIHEFYGGFRTSVFEFDKPLANKLHPTMKPLALLAQIITDGTQSNDIVYDPFLGSGSTLIACEQTGRICYGMEIDPVYVDVIIQRYINFVGTSKDVYIIRDNNKEAYIA